MRTRLNTYTGYSVGCAGVWAAILAIGERRLDPETRSILRLVCTRMVDGMDVGHHRPDRISAAEGTDTPC
jgi:hypothetical protein